MVAKKMRPAYIRIVGPDERAVEPLYRVKDRVSRGIEPSELYRRERELPGTLLHAYHGVLEFHGVEAAICFLDYGVAEGVVRRYRTTSGRPCYGLPITCLLPDAEERSRRFLVAFIAYCTGQTVRQVNARLRDDASQRRARRRICPGCNCPLNLVCERFVARELAFNH
jgi:hypothetical protein